VPYGGEIPSGYSSASLKLERYEPGAMDLPPGGKLIPNSSIVAFSTSAQTNVLWLNALLGPIGALTAGGPGANVSQAPLDLFDILKERIAQRSDLPPQEKPGDPDGSRLRLSPQGFLAVKDDGTATLTIQLDVVLLAGDGEIWKARYHYLPRAEYPVGGEAGWLSKNGEMLRQIANDGLNTALEALALDWKKAAYLKEAPIGECPFGKRVLPLLGTLNGKAATRRYVNGRTGTFVYFLDMKDCKLAN
jgi:hypothetical protein